MSDKIPPLTPDERARKLDAIRQSSDKLTELARHFDRMKFQAEKGSSDAFINLVDAAGRMTTSSLGQLATLLELVSGCGDHERGER